MGVLVPQWKGAPGRSAPLRNPRQNSYRAALELPMAYTHISEIISSYLRELYKPSYYRPWTVSVAGMGARNPSGREEINRGGLGEITQHFWMKGVQSRPGSPGFPFHSVRFRARANKKNLIHFIPRCNEQHIQGTCKFGRTAEYEAPQ